MFKVLFCFKDQEDNNNKATIEKCIYCRFGNFAEIFWASF